MQNGNIGVRILVVSQDELSANTLASALASAGHSASAVSGSPEAITALEAAKWDLVVIDADAQASEGLVTAGTLGARFDVPFLFIAKPQDDETVRQATGLGAIACLVKPQDIRQCIPTIETAIARAEDLRRLRLRETQLSTALQQNRATGVAVGILVERLRLSRDEAFETLRRRARSRRRTVTEVAEQLVASEEALNEIVRIHSRARQ